MVRIGLEDFVVRFDGPFGFASRDEERYQNRGDAYVCESSLYD